MDARKPYLLHLGSLVSGERMHLVFALAQGSHAAPQPADHFMFRQEYAESASTVRRKVTQFPRAGPENEAWEGRQSGF